MANDALEDRSERLATRVEGLATALHAGGVVEEAAARLLASASAAVLQALTLELLLEPPQPDFVPAAPLAEPEAPAERHVPLAA